jgi:hypothetical protein
MSNNFVKNPNVKVLMLKGAPGTTDYNDLENKPTKLSDFTNDGIFITNTSDDLVNYYTKTQDDALLSTKATTALYTGTLLSNGWSSSPAPYTQTVSITGILATDTPIADVVLDQSTSTAISQIEAWMSVSKIETADGAITATCFEEVPTIDIPIQLKVVR